MRRVEEWRKRRRERRGYDVRRNVRSNNFEFNVKVHYPSNYIKTSRYNILTFLPLNIFEQLHRVANVFFVVMMILTMTPISPVGAAPQIMAVACIMGFQAIKDAYEDYKRHRSDKKENSREVLVIRKQSYSDTTPLSSYPSSSPCLFAIPWSELKVGDIVRVENNQEIPADLLLLSSSHPTGKCFLETANLDGESNLKLRLSPSITAGCVEEEDLVELGVDVDADEPCVRLYEFEGSMKVDGNKEDVPLTIDSFLHRGTTLRNTAFVNGLVLYTGHQTKFMLNVSNPRHKMSKLEGILNQCIIGILVVLVVLCVGSALVYVEVYEYRISVNHWYLDINDTTGQLHDIVLSILTFVVVYGNLVPLSLYVNLEITRLVQAYLFENDLKMYDFEKKRTPMIRATNLMEELGQIDYIFADKTGTLTRNEMIFRICSIGTEEYGSMPDMEHEVIKQKKEEEKIEKLYHSTQEGNFNNDDYERINEYTPKRTRTNSFGAVIDNVAHRVDDMGQVVGDVVEEMGQAMEEAVEDVGQVMERIIEETDQLLHIKKKKKKKKEANKIEPTKEKIFASVPPHLLNPNYNQQQQQQAEKDKYWGEEKEELVVEEESLSSPSPSLGSNDYQLFLLSLAICNTVIPAKVKNETVYQSSSPDETALVLAAKDAGYELIERTQEYVRVSVFDEIYQIEVLGMNEFTSERRKMSTVIRMPNGVVRIFLKGADESIFPLVKGKEGEGVGIGKEKVDGFAERGLRTLVFGERVVGGEEERAWLREYNAARLATENRKELMQKAAQNIERNMRVLGTSGIEDRLQDLVPKTIEDLLNANIKVWVLTGDKGQTAINIAQTCRLIQPNHRIIRILGETQYDLDNAPQMILEGIAEGEAKRDIGSEGGVALVIDGKALGHVLEQGMQKELVRLGSLCSSVVCCRSTPVQKQQVVKTMKEALPIRTLAIGDGANDVAMIQEAHVGFGVMGNEGMQAVMSSDFVIGQFRFLKRALLVHGRWNYLRTGLSTCYVVYKNVFLTLIPFWFSFFCQFSGQVYLDPWMRTLWNFTFTGFPCVIYSFMEQDLPEEMLLKYPQLYSEGQKNTSFNTALFAKWFFFSVWDGFVSFFGVILTAYGLGEATNSGGTVGDLWGCATVTYTIMCVVSNLHLFLNTRHYNCVTHWTYWLSLWSWFIVALAYCTVACIAMGVPEMYHVAFHLYSEPLFWLILPVMIWVCILPDIIPLFWERTYRPSAKHILQERAIMKDYKKSHPPTGRWCCYGEDDEEEQFSLQFEEPL